MKKRIVKIFIILFIFVSVGNMSLGSSILDTNNEEYQRRLERAREITNSISATSQSSSETNPNEYVFITTNDAKFHKSGCDYMNGRPHKVTFQYAKENGYGACKYCYELSNNYHDSVFIIIIIIVVVFMTFFIGFGFYGYYKNKKGININQYNIKQK